MIDLTILGWKSFQQLCHTIVREILGQTVESFLDTNDGGRDGAFSGTWEQHGTEDLQGKFVIQCKHTSKQDYNIKKSDLDDELAKAKTLVDKNMCDAYILMTNAGISGKMKGELEKTFKGVGVKQFCIYGNNWIAQQIIENKNLRMLIPRVYGIGDLSQILDERAYKQAREILGSMKEDLSKFVITEAYRKSIVALNDYGFVLLIGEPAVGKTTTASMLALAAIDKWNASLIKADSPKEVKDFWNPDEPTQFFWIDDAFGTSQYEANKVNEWNRLLPMFNAILGKGAKIIMTSRDYLYQSAKENLKQSAFPVLQESQVVINVQDLTLDERQHILYNHLKLGKQSKTFLSEIKHHLESVASHPRFIPEIARRLSDPVFTKSLRINWYDLDRFIDKREELLVEIVQGLDQDSKAALGLIYMRMGRLVSPAKLKKSEEFAIQRLGSSLGGSLTALGALNDSLVKFIREEGSEHWAYKHPTIGDAFSLILANNPELLEIFLTGITPKKLIQQVTCGDVGLAKAIILPSKFYPNVISKLQAYLSEEDNDTAKWQREGLVQNFLTYRCSRYFISLYLKKNPRLLEQISSPSMYLNTSSEVRLAIKLYEYGLLPEENREKFIKTVSEYATDYGDLYALDDASIKNLFLQEELDGLVQQVQTQLIPRLNELRREFEENYRSEELPEEWMQPFLETIEILQRQFSNGDNSNEIFAKQLQLVQDWIAENSPYEPESVSGVFERIEANAVLGFQRSIFDDIDD